MAYTNNRQFWVLLHRWSGILIAFFMIIAGVTGTLLAFNDELEGIFAKRLFIAQKPYENALALKPLELREAFLKQNPSAIINGMGLEIENGKTLLLRPQKLDKDGKKLVPFANDWDEAFINPYNGQVQGVRKRGDLSQGMINFMPFIYTLHYTILLGKEGKLIMGVAALIWFIDSFVALYLTFPIKISKTHWGKQTKEWFNKWKPSWQIRWGSSAYKINFDLHRAGALWIFPLLLIFAWSSVGFNLNKEVYMPVMKIFGAKDIREHIPKLPKPISSPAIEFNQAYDLIIRKTIQNGNENNYKFNHPTFLNYNPTNGHYMMVFKSSRDFIDKGGQSRIFMNSKNGAITSLYLPSGQNGANTFTNWLYALHMGNVFGLPYRILVCFIGLLVTTLSVTGIIIWLKKRNARIAKIPRKSKIRILKEQNA